MGVVWGLLCLNANTTKPRYYYSPSSSSRRELVWPNSQGLMIRSLLNFTGRWIIISRGALRSWNFQNGRCCHGNREHMSKFWPHLYRKLPKGFPQDLAYILNRVGRIFWQKKSRANGRHFQIGRQQNRQNFNVLRFQWKLISIFCFKRGPNRGEVYKRNMCINYFLISAHLSNSITSDNRDPNNALNSDMGVVWGLLCLHPNTIKPRWIWIWAILDSAFSVPVSMCID